MWHRNALIVLVTLRTTQRLVFRIPLVFFRRVEKYANFSCLIQELNAPVFIGFAHSYFRFEFHAFSGVFDIYQGPSGDAKHRRRLAQFELKRSPSNPEMKVRQPFRHDALDAG